MTAGYQPPLVPREDWLVRRVMNLERQVRELQAARITRANIAEGDFAYDGGTFTYDDATQVCRNCLASRTGGWDLWFDRDGLPRRALGLVDPKTGQGNPDATTYADTTIDDNLGATLVFREGTNGWAYPPERAHVSDAITWNWTTGGTFASLWRGRVEHTHHEVIVVEGYAQCDTAGTVGDLRLFDAESGQATSVVTIPNATTCYRFVWLHPNGASYGDNRGGADRVDVGLQARRTAGTGQVQVYEPRQWDMSSRWLEPTAATNGNPTTC